MQSYSKRSVRTVTALFVTNLDTGADAEGIHESTVHWLEISPTIVDRVIANGTTMGSVRRRAVFFLLVLLCLVIELVLTCCAKLLLWSTIFILLILVFVQQSTVFDECVEINVLHDAPCTILACKRALRRYAVYFIRLLHRFSCTRSHAGCADLCPPPPPLLLPSTMRRTSQAGMSIVVGKVSSIPSQ